MDRKYVYVTVVLAIILLLIYLTIGSNSIKLQGKRLEIAQQFLDEQGYTVLSHEQSLKPYILTKRKLTIWPYISVWQAQSVEPDDYLGSIIYEERFIIQNHPFDNWEAGTTNKSLGKTYASLLIVNGEVVGGTSSPVTEQVLYGCCSALDGTKFEDQYPDIVWRTWADEWLEKYSKPNYSHYLYFAILFGIVWGVHYKLTQP